jgi:hypothetical protein
MSNSLEIQKFMTIDIHGLVIECQAESTELLSALVRPFKYFVRENGLPAVYVTIKKMDPPYETFPNIKASFSTPRNIVFKDQNRKIIDYFGKGVILEENKKLIYTLYGREINFLQEAFYLLILSLFGQHCDKKGMLRIHALALSYNDKAIIISLPSGGGKSTMALAILKEKDFKLISDDEAVIDNSGNILPFPLRIGVLDKKAIRSFPDEYVYKIDRMEFGIKYFVDCEYWKDRLEHRHLKESVLFTSNRLINGEPTIEEVSKRRVLSSLLRNAVVGVGLYQGLEFILNNSTWDVLSKSHIFYRRLILAFKFSLTTKSYQFNLSRDISRNVQVFKQVIENLT